MTKTGKPHFYLIVLKVWAKTENVFFFSDNSDEDVPLTNVTAEKKGSDGTKTTLHVSTPRKKQGTVQVTGNLCFTIYNKPLSLWLFLFRTWLWQFRRWALNWSFQEETLWNRDKHSKKEKDTYIRYIFNI